MAKTDPTKPLCSRCQKRNAQLIYKGLCHRCYVEMSKAYQEPLAALGDDIKAAKSDDDWKQLAAKLAPIVEQVASGALKATAAQAAMLKAIMDRAYGRVTKSQEEARVAAGIVVLPTIGDGITSRICPLCLAEHAKHGGLNNA